MFPSASEREPLTRFRRRRAVGSGSAGFTLVELLVVLLILALLIALLFPAIGSAIRAARNAGVQSEIQLLSQALADFNSKNGFYPPSRLVLTESGALNPATTILAPSGATSDITLGQLSQRTASTFRKLWPKVTLHTDGTAVFADGSNTFYDFNGNGVFDSTNFMLLQGHESLVFFLGGIPLGYTNSDGTVSLSMIGFGKDPANPFSNGIVGNSMYSNNRNPALFEFAPDRLKLTSAASLPANNVAFSHGIPGYIDSLNSQQSAIPQNFYAYFSSYPNGYDPNDVNLSIDEDGNGLSPLTLNFGSSLGGTASMTPNPYTTTCSVPDATNFNQIPTYDKAQSFQIISPGNDGMYGLGGYYKANANTAALPFPADPKELNVSRNATPANPGVHTNSTDLGVRNMERDNLTNFHNGKLD